MLKLIASVFARFFSRTTPTLSGTTKVAAGTGAVTALAVSLLVVFEGFAPVGHHDPIDPPGVNTICYGHIEGVRIGERKTKEQCLELLKKDLPRYEAMVKRAIHVPMPPHRHAAILSFTYNVGGGALAKSSVAKHLNAGRVQKACDALLLYHFANGKPIRGLKIRRAKERELCLRND